MNEMIETTEMTEMTEPTEPTEPTERIGIVRMSRMIEITGISIWRKMAIGCLLLFIVGAHIVGVYAYEKADTHTSDTHTDTHRGVGQVTDSRLLWLVNRDNRLAPDYVPQQLIQPSGSHKDGFAHNGLPVHPEAGAAFERMIDAMRRDGVAGLYIQSAYRTYNHQQQLFRNKKTLLLGLGYEEVDAIEMTARSIAFPGASEHQTGLAIDVTLDGTLLQSFADTEAGRWINDHAHLYGFIVRYAQGKTALTRIIYEPWHLRYTGLPHSLFIKENDLCFEEYIDYLKANRMYVYWDQDDTYYLVMYADTSDLTGLRNVIDLSTDRPGDGAGYIVTMKKQYPRTRMSRE